MWGDRSWRSIHVGPSTDIHTDTSELALGFEWADSGDWMLCAGSTDSVTKNWPVRFIPAGIFVQWRGRNTHNQMTTTPKVPILKVNQLGNNLEAYWSQRAQRNPQITTTTRYFKFGVVCFSPSEYEWIAPRNVSLMRKARDLNVKMKEHVWFLVYGHVPFRVPESLPSGHLLSSHLFHQCIHFREQQLFMEPCACLGAS